MLLGHAAVPSTGWALLTLALLGIGACSLKDLSHLQGGTAGSGGGGATASSSSGSSGGSGGDGASSSGSGSGGGGPGAAGSGGGGMGGDRSGAGGDGGVATGGGGDGGHGGGVAGEGGSGGNGGDGGDPPLVELERGLFLHYKFDEEEGEVAADATGNVDHEADVVGGTWVPGHLGNAISLSGEEQYVQLPAGIVQTLNEMTVAFWIYLRQNRLWQRAFDFGNGDDKAWIYVCPWAYMTGLRFSVNSTAGVNEYSTDDTLPVGQWVHVAVTLGFEPTRTSSIYVDGIEKEASISMKTRPSAVGVTTTNYIGRSQFAADPYLDGMIDDFRIYDRTLSAAEVAALASQ